MAPTPALDLTTSLLATCGQESLFKNVGFRPFVIIFNAHPTFFGAVGISQ